MKVGYINVPSYIGTSPIPRKPPHVCMCVCVWGGGIMHYWLLYRFHGSRSFKPQLNKNVEAGTSHALTYSHDRVRPCAQLHLATSSSAQLGATNEFLLSQGPVVRGLLGKCR